MSVITFVISTSELFGSVLSLSGDIVGKDEDDSVGVTVIKGRTFVACSLAASTAEAETRSWFIGED